MTGGRPCVRLWSTLNMAPKRSSLGAMRRQPTPRHLYTSPILIQTDDGRLFDSSIKFNHITGLKDNPFLVTKSRSSNTYIIMALAIAAFAYMIFSESLGFKSLIMADQRAKFQTPHVENNVTVAASSKASEVVIEESVDDALGPDDDAFAYSQDYDESFGDTTELKSGDESDSEDSVVRDKDEENVEDAEFEDAPSAGNETEIARDNSSLDEEHYDETDDERTNYSGNETELGTQEFEDDDAFATDDGEATESQRLSSRHNTTGLGSNDENAGDKVT